MRKRLPVLAACLTAFTLFLGGCTVPFTTGRDADSGEELSGESSAELPAVSSEESAEEADGESSGASFEKSSAGSSVADSAADSTAADDGTADPGQETEEPLGYTDDDLTKAVVSADGSIRIRVPESFGDVGELLDASDITEKRFPVRTGSVSEAMFLTGVAEEKDESYTPTLRQYLRAAVEGMTEFSGVLENVHIFGTKELTLGKRELPAMRTVLTADFNGETVFFAVYALEDGDRYLRFTGWSAASASQQALTTFEAIAASAADAPDEGAESGEASSSP